MHCFWDKLTAVAHLHPSEKLRSSFPNTQPIVPTYNAPWLLMLKFWSEMCAKKGDYGNIWHPLSWQQMSNTLTGYCIGKELVRSSPCFAFPHQQTPSPKTFSLFWFHLAIAEMLFSGWKGGGVIAKTKYLKSSQLGGFWATFLSNIWWHFALKRKYSHFRVLCVSYQTDPTLLSIPPFPCDDCMNVRVLNIGWHIHSQLHALRIWDECY